MGGDPIVDSNRAPVLLFSSRIVRDTFAPPPWYPISSAFGAVFGSTVEIPSSGSIVAHQSRLRAAWGGLISAISGVHSTSMVTIMRSWVVLGCVKYRTQSLKVMTISRSALTCSTVTSL